MRIGIKYCGGCNPRFDRTAMVIRLEQDLPDAVLDLAVREKPDYMVVLCGCSSACASHAHLDGKHGKNILIREEDYAPLLEKLQALSTASHPQHGQR